MILSQTQALKRRVAKIEKERGKKKKGIRYLIILRRDSNEVAIKFEIPII